MKNFLLGLTLMVALIAPQPALAQGPAEATAVIQIHPSLIEAPSGANGLLIGKNYLENVIASITAPATLEAAAKTLNLDLKHNKDALSQLRKSIIVSPRRGTDLLEIKVRDNDPKQAAAIANALADACAKRLNESVRQGAESDLKVLEEELAKQSERVQQHRQELTRLIQEYGIPSPGAKEAPGVQSEDPRGLEQALTSLKSAPRDQKLRIAAAISIPNNPVPEPYQNYLHALENLDYLQMNFKAKHPKIIAAKDEVTIAREKSHQSILQLTLLIEKQLADLARNPTTEEEIVDLARQQKLYNQAKEAYEQSRNIFRAINIKQQEGRILLKTPRNPVTIHERAK